MTSKAILPHEDHTYLTCVTGIVTQFTISICEIVVKEEGKWWKWTEGGKGMRRRSWTTDAFFHKNNSSPLCEIVTHGLEG